MQSRNINFLTPFFIGCDLGASWRCRTLEPTLAMQQGPVLAMAGAAVPAIPTDPAAEARQQRIAEERAKVLEKDRQAKVERERIRKQIEADRADVSRRPVRSSVCIFRLLPTCHPMLLLLPVFVFRHSLSIPSWKEG